MDYLKYIANTSRINQHPQGKLGTHLLLSKIPKNSKPMYILEIGCGTGHTAAILSNNNQFKYEGVDYMPDMINAAQKRKTALNLSNCNFTLTTSNKFPFNNNYFDIIFCESVLAIQNNNDLIKIIRESKRLLKENGLFLFNETIWNENSSLKIRKEINNKSYYNNNLILAEQNATLKNWESKLKTEGFYFDSISEINDLNKKKFVSSPINLENQSLIFTRKKILKSFLNPKYIFLFLFFKFMNKKIKIEKDALKSYIIVCKEI